MQPAGGAGVAFDEPQVDPVVDKVERRLPVVDVLGGESGNKIFQTRVVQRLEIGGRRAVEQVARAVGGVCQHLAVPAHGIVAHALPGDEFLLHPRIIRADAEVVQAAFPHAAHHRTPEAGMHGFQHRFARAAVKLHFVGRCHAPRGGKAHLRVLRHPFEKAEFVVQGEQGFVVGHPAFRPFGGGQIQFGEIEDILAGGDDAVRLRRQFRHRLRVARKIEARRRDAAVFAQSGKRAHGKAQAVAKHDAVAAAAGEVRPFQGGRGAGGGDEEVQCGVSFCGGSLVWRQGFRLPENGYAAG